MGRHERNQYLLSVIVIGIESVPNADKFFNAVKLAMLTILLIIILAGYKSYGLRMT